MPQNAAALNFIDRVLAYFSPGAGLRRAGQRALLAAAYEAATPSRHRKLHRSGLSPNQITQQGAVVLREQARHLQRNHDLSKGAVRVLVNNVVGPQGVGIEPQPRRADGSIHEAYAAALRNAYREWCRHPEVTNRLHFARVQRLMAATWLRDGESFAQEVVGPATGLTYATAVPMALELFEPDLVPYDYNEGTRIRQGIEINDWGRPVAYHVFKRNPAEFGLGYSASDLKRVSADRVHHITLTDRISQLRGVSVFDSVITRLEDMKDYEESERVAAKIAAMLTAYVKRLAPDGEGYNGPQVDANGNPVPRTLNLGPGAIIDTLAVGEEIGTIDSKRPNPNVVLFRQGQLRAVASGLGVSYSSLARDYSGTYSSQRQELVEQWVNYATLTDEFTGQFLQPLWDTFVSVSHLSGAVRRPADVAEQDANDALFVAQAMPWIDPLKEANSQVTLARAGLASMPDLIRRRGGNPRDVLEQARQWRSETDAAGMVFTTDARYAVDAANAQAEQDPNADPAGTPPAS